MVLETTCVIPLGNDHQTDRIEIAQTLRHCMVPDKNTIVLFVVF